MAETPFNALLKRERERRLQLLRQIQHKDLRHKAISYNLRIQNNSHPDSLNHTIRVQFGNPCQKTRVSKKLMSNSLHRHANSEQFHHFKETMIKGQLLGQGGSLKSGQTKHNNEGEDPKSHLGRSEEQVPEEHQGGRSGHRAERSGQHEEFRVVHDNSGQGKGRRALPMKIVNEYENITTIAQRRKLSLNFDLEVQGNTKNLRIKYTGSSRSPSRKRGKPSEENSPSNNRNWTATDPNVELAFEAGETLKPPCTFFRRFKEQHFPAAESQREEEDLRISKIRYNLSQLGAVEPIGESRRRSNAGSYRTVDGPTRLKRDIRSSCNPSSQLGSYTPSSSLNSRYSKMSSSQTLRMSFGSKPVASGLNEIRGWQVVVEGEDEGLLFKATDSHFLCH